MKKNEQLKEIREMSTDELRQKGRSIAEELLKLRFRRATGQLEQSHHMRDLRRTLARVQTLLTQRRHEVAQKASAHNEATKG